MTSSEQAPLRALSDTVEQWSLETEEFYSKLQQHLEQAQAGFESLGKAPAGVDTPNAAEAAMAERLATLQSENEALREAVQAESVARTRLQDQLATLEKARLDTEELSRQILALEEQLAAAKATIAALREHPVLPPQGLSREVSPETSSKAPESAPQFAVPPIRAFDPQGHKKKTGEILVDEGIITQQQLQQVLSAQAGSPQVRLGALAIERGFTSEALVAKVIAAQLRLPFVDLQAITVPPAALGALSNHLARLHQCIPLQRDQNRLIVAMANPLDLIAIEDIELATKLSVEPVVASSVAIQVAVERYYPAGS